MSTFDQLDHPPNLSFLVDHKRSNLECKIYPLMPLSPIKTDRVNSRVQGANRRVRHASRRKALPAAPRPGKGQPPIPPAFPCSARHLRREFLVCAAFQRATIPPYPPHHYQLAPVGSMSFAPSRALAPESAPCADLAALTPIDLGVRHGPKLVFWALTWVRLSLKLGGGLRVRI